MRAAIALMTLVVAGCATPAAQHPSPARLAQLGADFDLRIGEEVGIAGSPLTLKFERVVEESRCPMNARCVWEGNASIAVHVDEVSPLEKNLVHVTGITLALNTSSRFAQRQAFGKHDVLLVHLEPTPMTGETPQDYVATLRVEARP